MHMLNSSLHQQMIVSYGYIQHILEFTIDNRTTINHIYTNLNESRVQTGVLETFFCDHKAVCIAIKNKNKTKQKNKNKNKKKRWTHFLRL